MLHRHVHDDDRRAARDALPVDRRRREPALVVAGEERDGVVEVAMRDRNAGIGEPADARRNARHDAERDAASTSASASSPPRPNTKGSPPFSRQTRFPARASATSFSEMSRCFGDGFPPRLPAYSIVAPGRA